MNAFEKAVKKSAHIPVWMDLNEREELFNQAAALPENSSIMEIGCLFGGSTAMLALGSRNKSRIFVMDDFSWQPPVPAGMDSLPVACKKTVIDFMESIGATEIFVLDGDSLYAEQGIVKTMLNTDKLNLLWIDGGHSLQYIQHDIETFGPLADTILCHDYGNEYWTTIKQAVDFFLKYHTDYYLDHVTGTVAVIKRK